MRWEAGTTEYEAVWQYLDVVQKNQFVAVAAGVVVHQHTRVLMADLYRCGDDTSAAGVRAGMQQLAAELAAAYKAAAVGPTELQRVVVELSSGPQGKATVDRRVAEANARVAETRSVVVQCARERRREFEGNRGWRRGQHWLNGWWRQWRAHRQRWMNTDDRQWGSCRRHGNSRGVSRRMRTEERGETRGGRRRQRWVQGSMMRWCSTRRGADRKAKR